MKGSIAALPADHAARLRNAPVSERIPGRNRTKAEISVHTLDGRKIAVKDYRARSFLIRHVLGRYLTGRESRAYLAAGRIDGLAHFVGRVDRFALATEWVEGRTLRSILPGQHPSDLFERLAETLRQLHSRGVALADLHQRDVVVGNHGELAVVDLAAAWIVRPGSGAMRDAVFRRLCHQDDIALARIRAHFSGEDEQAALSGLDSAAVARYRSGRRIKSRFDRLRGRGH